MRFSAGSTAQAVGGRISYSMPQAAVGEGLDMADKYRLCEHNAGKSGLGF